MKTSTHRIPATRAKIKFIALIIHSALCTSVYASVTCQPQGSEILLGQLPTDEITKILDLRPAKSRPGDEGKFRLVQKEGRALQVTTDGTSICAISFAPETNDGNKNRSITANSGSRASDPAFEAAVNKVIAQNKATREADTKIDAKIAKMILEGREDLGVPASPALHLIGVEASKATHPKTPKDLAAALVQGRGDDGKIKSGVAVDVSLAQLFSVLFSPKATAKTEKTESNSINATDIMRTKASSPKIAGFKLSTTEAASYAVQQSRKSGAVSTFNFLRAAQDVKENSAQSSEDADTSHRLLNRVKLSLATTQDDGTAQSAADFAYGAHYVLWDYSDPLTSRCDGVNNQDADVQARVKQFIFDRSNKLHSAPVEAAELRQLITNRYPGVAVSESDFYPELNPQLNPLLAACSLVPLERLSASAAMIGIAQSYRLTDGSWSKRQSGAKGVWATYLTPGLRAFGDTSIQGILHGNLRRNLRTPDPEDSKKFLRQDSNLISARIRLAGERGAGSLEFSRSKNTTDGKPETVNRRALALEWKLAKGIWLVGSGGLEKSSLGASKSKPFVITNLRFGGSPAIPGAVE
jgi:hypothetical protein